MNFVFIVLTLVMLTPLYFIFKKLTLPFIPLYWVLLTGLLGYLEFFLNFELPPRIPFFLLASTLFLFWVIFFSKKSEKIRGIPWALLILPQMFRIFVELGLAQLYSAGKLPIEMTFHGRNFDILVGLSAPLIFLFQKTKWRKPAFLLWNFAGIGILSVVVIHGMLSMPYPFQTLALEPNSSYLAQFPYLWLPFFLVPTAYFLHLASIRKIYLEKNA